MANGLDITTIPFRLRGESGTVSVLYGVNEDPVRWGWGVLDLEWFSPELIRGFPIVQATVEHPAEGYAAEMGWLQVVRYDVRDPGEEEELTVFDVPPQLAETDTPYAAFGVRPTFFDAPAMGAKDATWEADTFLVYTPDAVLSKVIRADMRVLMGLPAPRWRRSPGSTQRRRCERLAKKPVRPARAVPYMDLRGRAPVDAARIRSCSASRSERARRWRGSHRS